MSHGEKQRIYFRVAKWDGQSTGGAEARANVVLVEKQPTSYLRSIHL
jgi:hypothetical protein